MEMILEIKRQRGKAIVTVSDGSVIQVQLALLRERPLHEGEPIDLEAYDNWLLLKQYRPALDRAVAALAARAHSRREIEDKIASKMVEVGEDGLIGINVAVMDDKIVIAAL